MCSLWCDWCFAPQAPPWSLPRSPPYLDRAVPYILACFHVQRHCQKAYSDCSIVAARTRFLSSHTVSSPNSLIERRVRGAWRSSMPPARVERERAHGRLARRVRGSSCVKKKRCKWSRPSAAGKGSDAPDQFRVESTASACGTAGRELGSGAEPRACGLADDLGLGKGLVACARPARI